MKLYLRVSKNEGYRQYLNRRQGKMIFEVKGFKKIGGVPLYE